jgi:hypothetical protein
MKINQAHLVIGKFGNWVIEKPQGSCGPRFAITKLPNYQITKSLLLALCLCASVAGVHAQNWTTVTAANISDLAGNKLASGKLCLTATDADDRAISFRVGGGGQVIGKTICAAILNGGLAAALAIPNPAYTAPANVLYRIEVTDGFTNVLRYTRATIPPGATFDFDTYVPNGGTIQAGASVDSLTVSTLRFADGSQQTSAGCGCSK